MSLGKLVSITDTSLSLSITYLLCTELLTGLNRPNKCFLHISAIPEELVGRTPNYSVSEGRFLIIERIDFSQDLTLLHVPKF